MERKMWGKSNLWKCTVLVILTVALMVVGNSKAYSGQKVRFVTSSKVMCYLPRMVALDKNFFAEEGLDIEVINIPGGSKAAAALLGGSADIVNLGLFHALKAARKGFDVVAFATPFNQWPHTYLMKPEMMKKKGITVNSTLDEKIKAMKGLKIGCTSPGSGTDLIPRLFLKNRGINPEKDVKIVPFGNQAAGIAAFERGLIDVFQWVSPIPELLEQKGVGTVIFSAPAGDIPEINGWAWDSYFTTRKYMEAHPDVILAFTKAIIKAINYIHNNEEGTLEIIGKRWPDASPQLRKTSYFNLRKAIPKNPRITKRGYQTSIDLLFSDIEGEEKERVSYEKTVTNKFVDQALKE